MDSTPRVDSARTTFYETTALTSLRDGASSLGRGKEKADGVTQGVDENRHWRMERSSRGGGVEGT